MYEGHAALVAMGWKKQIQNWSADSSFSQQNVVSLSQTTQFLSIYTNNLQGQLEKLKAFGMRQKSGETLPLVIGT